MVAPCDCDFDCFSNIFVSLWFHKKEHLLNTVVLEFLKNSKYKYIFRAWIFYEILNIRGPWRTYFDHIYENLTILIKIFIDLEEINNYSSSIQTIKKKDYKNPSRNKDFREFFKKCGSKGFSKLRTRFYRLKFSKIGKTGTGFLKSVLKIETSNKLHFSGKNLLHTCIEAFF